MLTKRIGLYAGKDYPCVDTYILHKIGEKDTSRGAVVIVPGGGYTHVSEREAEPVAMKFAAAGYHTFVVWYRVNPEKYTDPMEDLARAVAMIRQNAAEWRVDPENISVCGFSAGGHLTASLGVFWDKPFLSEITGLDKELYKPNRLILCYPVITTGEKAHEGSFQALSGGDESLRELLSLEKQVSDSTPPTFLWHTAEDAGVPVENSFLFGAALHENNIPFEMHIFPHGGHGQSIAEPYVNLDYPQALSPDCAKWTEYVIDWLKK